MVESERGKSHSHANLSSVLLKYASCMCNINQFLRMDYTPAEYRTSMPCYSHKMKGLADSHPNHAFLLKYLLFFLPQNDVSGLGSVPLRTYPILG